MGIAALLLAAKLTPGAVALSIESAAADRATVVREALTDEDARVRSAAARVVAVTDAKDLLGDVRTALAKETNPEAAREEIRAIGITNGVADLDALLDAAKKFGVEKDAWIAVARGAGPDAVSAAIAHKVSIPPVFRYGMWGHPELATAFTSRVLGQNDAELWSSWLSSLDTAGISLDPTIGAVALASPNPKIAAATTWHFARQYTDAPPADPKPLLDALDRAIAARPDADTSESFARELLARALGRPPKERPEWIDFAGSWKEHGISMWSFDSLITPEEASAAHVTRPKGVRAKRIEPIGNASFTLMTGLPKGVADEVIQATGCNGEWLGFAAAAVDRAGRVRDVNVKEAAQTDACRRALNVLIRTSLAQDLASSPPPLFAANDILLVHKGKTDGCLDEGDVVPDAPAEPLRVSPQITPPKKLNSVEPLYPESERLARISGIIILETHINAHGCVEAIKILKPLTAALNTSAIVAVSQWRFAPALLDGKPVDVIYNLTINFKLK